MMTCPHCQRTEQQVKVGFNRSGSQRYLCRMCKRKYTPAPIAQGYDAAKRQTALQMYVDGMNRRQLFKREHPNYAAHIRDFVHP
jgi:transposase-like protein